MNFQNKRNFHSSIKYLIIYIVTDIKNTSYIGTLEFFEQVDEEVRKNIKKIWQTSINR